MRFGVHYIERRAVHVSTIAATGTKSPPPGLPIPIVTVRGVPCRGLSHRPAQRLGELTKYSIPSECRNQGLREGFRQTGVSSMRSKRSHTSRTAPYPPRSRSAGTSHTDRTSGDVNRVTTMGNATAFTTVQIVHVVGDERELVIAECASLRR